MRDIGDRLLHSADRLAIQAGPRSRSNSSLSMNIRAFTSDKEKVEHWLKAFVTSFVTEDT